MNNGIKPFKIIIIGESGIGKSSLMVKYTEGTFTNYHNTTIGVDFIFKKIKLDGSYIGFHIWDTAGQEKFKSIVRSYYLNTDGIILVFDINSRFTFDNLDYWINEIKYTGRQKYPMILIGNKTDLNNHVISDEEVSEFIKKTGMDFTYIKTSVKFDKNVNLVFETLGRKILEHNKKIAEQDKLEEERIRLESLKSNSSCCYKN